MTDFFFKYYYNTTLVNCDSRAELWLPPGRTKSAWGFYGRVAGVVGFKDLQSLEQAKPPLQGFAFPNAWLASPGVGFQAYPFSFPRIRPSSATAQRILGPVRFFADYNRTDYVGTRNSWRPHSQARIGFEYWKAVNVNNPDRKEWLEVWNGFYWQSSNEFTPTYDSLIFANSWRAGIRKPNFGVMSTISPYVAVESSRTKYNRPKSQPCGFTLHPEIYPENLNPCDFYWENRLLGGVGVRYAPSLASVRWLQRFVVYIEYLNTAAYYGPTPPSPAPRFDLKVGVSASIGQWYK
jgi:hypothetical protein